MRKEWAFFDKIAPVFKDRPGGYTRIIRIGQRPGDASPVAIIELVETPVESAAEAPAAVKAVDSK